MIVKSYVLARKEMVPVHLPLQQDLLINRNISLDWILPKTSTKTNEGKWATWRWSVKRQQVINLATKPHYVNIVEVHGRLPWEPPLSATCFYSFFFSYIKLPTYSLVSIRRFMVYSTRSIRTKEVGRLFITPCPPARSRKLFIVPSWWLARICEFCF